MLYDLSDGPAGLLVLSSAAVLALIGRECWPGHPTTRMIGNALYWAAISIAAVAVIYFAFAWSVDVGKTVRPWAKTVSGIAAGVSAWCGLQVVRRGRWTSS